MKGWCVLRQIDGFTPSVEFRAETQDEAKGFLRGMVHMATKLGFAGHLSTNEISASISRYKYEIVEVATDDTTSNGVTA